MNKSVSVLFLPLCFVACRSQQTDTALNDLRSQLQTKSISVPSASVAVVYKNLGTDQWLGINENVLMHAASTMKVPVMIEVFKQAEEGLFNLSDSLLVKNEFKSIVDGSPYSMELGEDSDESIYRLIGQRMTIRDLTYQMITVSSNLATNLLIDLVRPENIMATMSEIGAHEIRVLRGVEDIKAFRAGKNNVTTAFDLMLIMQSIAQKRIATPEACDEMIAILRRQKFRDKIPKFLPASAQVANKTGSITEIDHDFATVMPPESPPYILVVMTKGIKNKETAKQLIAEISKLVYDYHTNLKSTHAS